MSTNTLSYMLRVILRVTEAVITRTGLVADVTMKTSARRNHTPVRVIEEDTPQRRQEASRSGRGAYPAEAKLTSGAPTDLGPGRPEIRAEVCAATRPKLEGTSGSEDCAKSAPDSRL